MRKNELVHLHALLVLLSEDFIERGVVQRSHFEPYLDLGVSPVAFRARRDRHEEAVLLLSTLLAEAAALDEDTYADSDAARTTSASSSSSS